jgi:aspartate kinase
MSAIPGTSPTRKPSSAAAAFALDAVEPEPRLCPVTAREQDGTLAAVDERPTLGSTTVVMKFGGTSVAGPERIRDVARRLVQARAQGARVVAVVSATGQTVEELIRLAHAVSPEPDGRELDLLRSVGERVSCALVAMAVNDLGSKAISLTGSQAGVITDSVHGRATIVEVRPRRVEAALDGDRIVLVAGFQGMSGEEHDITTLGPGGADVTAVALAAALRAGACEIYTDVAGVLTADPRVVPEARKLAHVCFEEMLELAAAGARVLPLRSVEVARNYGVALHVRGTLGPVTGTWITEESNPGMEKALVTAIAHTDEEAVYRVQGTGVAELLARLADNHVNVNTIMQTGADAVVFSAPLAERPLATASLDGLGATFTEQDGLGKITLVGTGMKTHPGVAARTFGTLRDLGVEPRFLSTSPIRISFYVPREAMESTVRALHEAFELGREEKRGA